MRKKIVITCFSEEGMAPGCLGMISGGGGYEVIGGGARGLACVTHLADVKHVCHVVVVKAALGFGSQK